MDDAARGQNPLPPASKVARERGGGEREAIDGVGFVRKGKNYRQEKFLR